LADRFYYKGQDVTVDLIMKTEHAVTLIAESEGIAFDDAYRAFSKSQTCKALENTASLLWAESAEFIVDEYYREQG
jgi:hypothetical protein